MSYQTVLRKGENVLSADDARVADVSLARTLALRENSAHLAEESRRKEILARFERKDLDTDTVQAIAASTSYFRQSATLILNTTKPGREQSLALTALEEAKFWTNQAIALNANSIIDQKETA